MVLEKYNDTKLLWSFMVVFFTGAYEYSSSFGVVSQRNAEGILKF